MHNACLELFIDVKFCVTTDLQYMYALVKLFFLQSVKQEHDSIIESSFSFQFGGSN
jgi:hypothetical protein